MEGQVEVIEGHQEFYIKILKNKSRLFWYYFILYMYLSCDKTWKDSVNHKVEHEKRFSFRQEKLVKQPCTLSLFYAEDDQSLIVSAKLSWALKTEPITQNWPHHSKLIKVPWKWGNRHRHITDENFVVWNISILHNIYICILYCYNVVIGILFLSNKENYLFSINNMIKLSSWSICLDKMNK